MRICVFSEGMAWPFDEGIKNFALNLGKGLAQDHHVLALTTRGQDFAAYGIENIQANRLLLSPGFAARIRAFCPELVLYVPTACATLFSFLRARVLKGYARGAPVALIALQPRRYSGVALSLMPRLLPDALLVQSERTQFSLDFLHTPVELWPPSVATERFRPVSAPARRLLRQRHAIDAADYVILHVGHLNRGRNVQALSALARAPGHRVLVVGSTSTPHDQQLVSSLEADGVRVIDEFLPDVAEIYQLADCYVFPVNSETSSIDLPLSVLEAMACDLPVVTTRFGGLPALFDGVPGFRYIDDLEQLPAAVEACRHLKQPGTRAMVEPYAWPQASTRILGRLCEMLSLTKGARTA